MACLDKSEVNSLIGLPYEKGGMGPRAFDCWGLTRHVQKQFFGRDLPIVLVDRRDIRAVVETFRSVEERRNWCPRRKDERPKAGDLVTMVRVGDERHIGTWLDFDAGGILHALEGWGVCFDARAVLHTQGWTRLVFYGWAN